MTFRRFYPYPVCGVLLASCLVATAVSQTVASSTSPGGDTPSTPDTTLSVKVNVVNVLASVRDKHGKIVNNLGKDDFVLTEDGHQQQIHYFAKESDLPLTLGLLVDTSLSQRRVLDEEKNASHSFLDQMMRVDKDKAFVIHFDREVELLQDLTPDTQKLGAALDDLETPRLERTNGGGGDPQDPGRGRGGRGGGGHWAGAGTLLYDSVYLASNEVMKSQQGRKAIIVLTDGVDMGSKESLEEAVESAQRADTVVYSILFKDDESRGGWGGFGGPRLGGPGMGGPGMGGPGMGEGGMGRPRGGSRYPQENRPDGKKVLERISTETGGRMFEVSKKLHIGDIYAQIEEELRNQYSLGYTPDSSTAGYHKIQLTTKTKGLVVQARDGYYR